jgi:hypothetical protein
LRVERLRRVASVLVAAVAVLAVLAVGGCGSDGSSTTSSTTVAEPTTGPVRAKMLPDGFGFASSGVEWPANGGWGATAGSGETSQTLDVTVGGLATSVRHVGDTNSNLPRAVRKRLAARRLAHPRDGFIEIDTEGFTASQYKPVAAMHGTGALRITKAPTGNGLPRSVLNADIEFTSQSGTTGTLHLKNDTVTLNNDPSG